jgi:hypothetical protein
VKIVCWIGSITIAVSASTDWSVEVGTPALDATDTDTDNSVDSAIELEAWSTSLDEEAVEDTLA